MKTVYICEYTGEQFDNPYDCEVSEYHNGEQRQKFFDLVYDFINELHKKYPDIIIDESSLKMTDRKEFYIQDRIVRDRRVVFNFTMNGEEYNYARYSDEVGDYRWDWNIEDTVESFILDFEKEFIYPKLTVLEGRTSYEWDRKMIFKFEEMDSHYFLSLIGNKKIRIEILEDNSI